MDPNPYESPKSVSPAEPPPDSSATVVRRGIPLAIGIAWNAPLAAVLVLLFRGAISERTMERAMAAWTLVIPLSCLALLFVPPVRRLVFTSVNMTDLRPKLWTLAALWLAIFIVWIVADVARGG